MQPEPNERRLTDWLQKVVRKRGFEPPWYCYRQPLKLVDLLC